MYICRGLRCPSGFSFPLFQFKSLSVSLLFFKKKGDQMGCWALGIPQPDAAPSQVLSAWETKKCFIGKCICTASVNINRIHTLDIRVSLHLLPTLYSQWHWITGGWVIPGGFCSVGQSKPELDVRCFLASHCVCVAGNIVYVCVCSIVFSF